MKWLKKVLFYLSLFRIFLRIIVLRRNLVILDLDNTLAKTREYVRKHGRYDYDCFEPINEVVRIVENHYLLNNHNTDYIALTVRPLSSYFKTRRWIRGSINFEMSLFFAASQQMKVIMVKGLAAFSKSTLFVDDFTYGIDDVLIYKEELKQILLFKDKNRNFDFYRPNELLNNNV